MNMKHIDTLFILPDHTENNKTNKSSTAKPRLKIPIRNQVEVMVGCLDDYVPENHKVRAIAKYVGQLDLSSILNKIKSVESSV